MLFFYFTHLQKSFHFIFNFNIIKNKGLDGKSLDKAKFKLGIVAQKFTYLYSKGVR